MTTQAITPTKSTNWIGFSQKGSHDAELLVRLGRWIPTTVRHLKFFTYIDVIGYDDVKLMEDKYGVTLVTKPTKSGYWLRIVNQQEVIDAIKKCVKENKA
jgi:hypothetical protein